MDKKQSAEEIELAQEEQALRSEAEQISPPRPEDAEIPDVPSEAEARAAAHGEKTPKSNQRPAGDKKADATGANKPAESKAHQKPEDGSQKPEAQKTHDKTAKPGEAATADKAQSKFQQERARLDTTWKQVQAEREQIAREREQLAAERRALTERPARPHTTEKPKIDGGTADDWDKVARDFEADGDAQLAEKAKANAAKLREQEKAAGAHGGGQQRERFTPAEVAEMKVQWAANLEKAGKENPELTQEGTPLRARVAELLKTMALLHNSGDGITVAVEYAKNELKAKQADELEAKVTELEKEVERLTGLTSLETGGAAPAATARKFDDLSIDEQEAALREETAA